jgi:hypothetical protein
MSTFTTPLIVKYLDGRRWELTEEFDFASDTLERIIRVPIGFTTDFASIPRILWIIFPPTGKYGKAAVIHDDLYQFPQMIIPSITRLQADRTLFEGMVALRVNFLTRWIIYLGVRIGGWRFYKKN